MTIQTILEEFDKKFPNYPDNLLGDRLKEFLQKSLTDLIDSVPSDMEAMCEGLKEVNGETNGWTVCLNKINEWKNNLKK
jgi:hypothetical protein